MMAAPALKIIRLLEPGLCLTCQFAGIATVTTKDGDRRMLKCRRLDCDNFDVVVEEGPQVVEVQA